MKKSMKRLIASIGASLLVGGIALSNVPVHAVTGGWWEQDEGGWRYIYDAGYVGMSWIEIDGYWYYFDDNAYMEYSAYRDGCWLNSDGTWNTSYSGGYWASNDTGWWYTDSSGWYPVSQWLWIDGNCYYFKADGYMAADEWIDGCWVDSSGAWVQDYTGDNTEEENEEENEENVVKGWKATAISLVEAYKYDEAKELEDMEFDSEEEKQEYLEEEKKEEGKWAIIYLDGDEYPELAHIYERKDAFDNYSAMIEIYTYDPVDNGWGHDGYERCYYCGDGTQNVYVAGKIGVVEGYVPEGNRHDEEWDAEKGDYVKIDNPYTSYSGFVREFHPDQDLFNIYSISKTVYDNGKVECGKAYQNYDDEVIALGYPKSGTEVKITEKEYNDFTKGLVNINDIVTDIDTVLAQLNNM